MSKPNMISGLIPFTNQQQIVPPSILGDILYITNFFKYFKDYLDIDHFQTEQLYIQLVYKDYKELKLIYLLKLAFVKIIIEQYRYTDSQNILLINVIKHYYQYCKIYQRKNIEEIKNKFNRELMLLWSHLFYDFLKQDSIMIENKSEVLAMLKNEFREVGLLDQQYKNIQMEKKLLVLKSMVQGSMQLDLIRNWAKQIMAKKDSNSTAKSQKDIANKSQKLQLLVQKSQSLQGELQDQSSKKGKQTAISKKKEVVDQQIIAITEELSQLKFQQSNIIKDSNVVSCNYIGSLSDDIHLYYFQFQTDTIYLQHLNQQGEHWYVMNEKDKIDELIQQLKMHQTYFGVGKSIDQLIDNNMLTISVTRQNQTIQQYIDQIEQDKQQKYEMGQNVYDQILTRISEIEQKYSEYLAHKCCRWESPQKKQSIMNQLKELDQMDDYEQSQLILQILNSFLSVQYLYIFDPQIDYEGHKNIFKERFDEKYVNELERLQKMDSDDVQVYRMQVGVLGSYRVMHNYRGQIKEFLVAGQPIQYLNVLVFYMHISILSYIRYYVNLNLQRRQVDFDSFQYKKTFQKCQMCKTSKKCNIIECSICKKTYHSICMTFEQNKSCYLCNSTITRTRTRRLQINDDDE